MMAVCPPAGEVISDTLQTHRLSTHMVFGAPGICLGGK